MIFVEYFSKAMLVEHQVEEPCKRTACDEPLKGKLPARPVDLRAVGKGKTVYTKCLDCAMACAPVERRPRYDWRTRTIKEA